MSQLTPRRRNQVVGLLQANLSCREIARRMGVSHTTIVRLRARWETELTVDRREVPGRPRVSNEEEDNRIVEYFRNNPFSNPRDARVAVNFPGSVHTVRRRLFACGLRARRAATKEILTEAHRVARLNFARKYLYKDVAFWDRVVFTDEKTFSSTTSGPVVVYRPKNSRFNPKYVHGRARSGRFSAHAWAWICAAGPGTCWRIEGNLNGDQYVQILDGVMLPAVGSMFPLGFIYQQVKNLCSVVMQELETALAQQATPQEDPSLYKLPPLIINGIPIPVEKMTQAQLRSFIPFMLKYSTGRGRPGWGKESMRPPWWPKKLPWANARTDARSEEEKQKMSWTNALRQIVMQCYKYHEREDLLQVFSEEDEIHTSQRDGTPTVHAVQTLAEVAAAAGGGGDGTTGVAVDLNKLTEATLGQDSHIILTGEDGHTVKPRYFDIG